jgi:hypothetical protein
VWKKGGYCELSEGVMFLSLKKLSIVCLKSSFLNFIPSFANIFFKNDDKTLVPDGCSGCNAKFSLALSCEPTISNPDIRLSYLWTLYSQSLDMLDNNTNITEKHQSTRQRIEEQQSVFSFDE